MMRFIAALLLVAYASAYHLAAPPTSTAVASRAGTCVMYGKLPKEALVPRCKVSMNPIDNMMQMADQRVAGCAHILLAPGKCTLPLEEAKALMVSWKNEIGGDGEAFAEKAKVESHCPTAAKGGDLGFLVRAAACEEFNKILFEAEPGNTYGPIVTPAGLHLIYLASCREPKPSEDADKNLPTGMSMPEMPKMPKMPWE